MGDANYRKHNDTSQNSSTYHKKDGTSTRAILKKEARLLIDLNDKEIEKEVTDKGC